MRIPRKGRWRQNGKWFRSLLCGQAVILLIGAHSPAGDWSPFEPIPPARPVPLAADTGWSNNPVDAFVRARLDQRGLSPAPPVGRRTWIRRVTYDLIGLPPAPEEIQAFLRDERPDAVAYGDVVDRLLASPHYGERWARHWLDVVRYAETDGFAIDGERPTLWRYRDYVIRSLNEDRPFDRFIREQLAGDEIGAGTDGLIATGFYRLGPYEQDNMVPENRRQDFLNEVTSAVGSVFLGLTVGCARCHDHKYDPIPQADFYRVQAFFTPFERSQEPAPFLDDELPGHVRHRKAKADAEMARRREALDEHRRALRGKLADALGKAAEEIPDDLFDKAARGESIPIGGEPSAASNGDSPVEAPKPGADSPAPTVAADPRPPEFQFREADRDKLEQLKKAVEDYEKSADRFAANACTIRNPDTGNEPPETRVLHNGDVFAPGDVVQPGFLSAVQSWGGELSDRLQATSDSAAGRRRVLAEWIASPHNPLTARVIVNRVWQYHFGRGIVETANDFGRNGSGPSHPELLDFLASSFIEHGWRLKPLHRMLVLSRTYRLASYHPAWDSSAAVDPDNRLLWRANVRRLEAETIRDALLAVSGRLNRQPGGPGFCEVLPEGVGLRYSFFSWEPSSDEQRRRRSIYMFQRRNLVHPMMEAFDVADMAQPCERRQSSVTAAQALSLLNGKLADEASRHLAERLYSEVAGRPDALVERLFWMAFGRPAEPDEMELCLRFLDAKTESYRAKAEGAAEAASTNSSPGFLAWRDLCLVALNANEFVYLD